MVQTLPDNAPTAIEFSQGGFHQVPPGPRAEWEHDFYSKHCGFVRFRHKISGETVVCPNIWYNGTPEASIERRQFWIAEAKERLKYWNAQRDSFEKEDNIRHHTKAIARFEADIERIKQTGVVI